MGADTFYVGLGDDTATDGEGADVYVIKSGASGSLTVTDFDITEDRIDLIGLGDPLSFDFINWTVYGNNVEFSVAGSQYSVTHHKC